MGPHTLDQVRELAADVLGLHPADVQADSSPEKLEGWDSVRLLNLVLALEQRFGVQFEVEEIDSMKTIGLMAGVVDLKLARIHPDGNHF